ncbi:MAG: sialate O-acetylesterase, partial [Planctomycetota bacterium]|nr:sialate O-acetylesterase [Planctomycetota bacterium]
YRFPGKGVPSERTKLQHGQEYGPLIEKTREAFACKSFDTVTFVWMQGESDGMRGLGPAYEKSFLRLLGRIKKDLNRKDVTFVIGRINDSHMRDPNWKAMRDVQVKLAEDTDHGAWINTDDLSEPEHGVHFPGENYQKLGQRFAEKAIVLIRKGSAIK